jgi:hypothetical protein
MSGGNMPLNTGPLAPHFEQRLLLVQVRGFWGVSIPKNSSSLGIPFLEGLGIPCFQRCTSPAKPHSVQ